MWVVEVGLKIPKKKNGLENVFLNIKGTKKKKKKKNASVCEGEIGWERKNARMYEMCEERERGRENIDW